MITHAHKLRTTAPAGTTLVTAPDGLTRNMPIVITNYPKLTLVQSAAEATTEVYFVSPNTLI
jgi:hypothetical protein